MEHSPFVDPCSMMKAPFFVVIFSINPFKIVSKIEGDRDEPLGEAMRK